MAFDWGSFWGGVIAGLFTLAGGGLAYWAGLRQAKATKDASATEVKAIREQMQQERDLMADRDERAKRALTAALFNEATRTKMLLTECLSSYLQRHGGFGGWMGGDLAKSFVVRPDRTTRAALVADPGVSEAVKASATTLYARLDILSTLAEIRAERQSILSTEIKDAVENVMEAAQALEKETAAALAINP